MDVSSNSMRNFHWNSNLERAGLVDLRKNHITNFTIVSSDHYVTKTKFVLSRNSLTSIEFTLKNLQVNDGYTFLLDNNPFGRIYFGRKITVQSFEFYISVNMD